MGKREESCNAAKGSKKHNIIKNEKHNAINENKKK